MPEAIQPKLAADFALIDTTGRAVHMSDYRGRQNVVLVFNRGFA
jgi:peroxiredoxin